MITIEKIESREGFRALKEEWNELLGASGVDCIFLTWEWLYTWWLYLGEDRRLFIITVRRAGRLIAIAPLCQRPCRIRRLLPFRSLEFLGSGNVGSDFLNLIIRKGFEDEALQSIAGCLGERNLVLQLSQVDRTSSQMVNLVLKLRQMGWQPSRRTVDFCPYIDLRGLTFEDYVASLGRSHRSNFRKKLRKLEKRFRLEFCHVRTEAERVQALDTLVNLHLQRWGTRGGSDALHTPSLIEFHKDFTREALRKGWLRLFVMRLNDKPVVALYCFSYQNKYYFYQAGFDMKFSRYSVGLGAVGLAISQAFEEGAEEYDFLRGNEKYKYLWANEERELVRLDLFPPYIRGTLYKQAMELREEAKKLVWQWVSPRLSE